MPTVLINTRNVSAARDGAVPPGVVTPWASLSGARVDSALPQTLGPAAATTHADFATSRRAAAMTQPLAVMAAARPAGIRKQYVHKTRVNVGGGGASGPHPEREPV